MEGQSFSSVLKPFNTLDQYLSALKILQSHYSSLHDNKSDVAVLIKQSVDNSITITNLEKFIERVIIFPSIHGLDFMRNLNSFHEIIKVNTEKLKTHSMVITPQISRCIFCHDSQLIKKKQDFLKTVLFFGRSKKKC